MDQLDEIKAKIDLVEMIGAYVPLKKAGSNFKGLCPFHAEKTPSFMVSPERQIWKCFGCGEGGDAFTFLMKMENMEFGEALRELAKKTGVKLDSYQPTQAEKDKEILFDINHMASEYYHFVLLNLPVAKKALDYVLGRGVSRESVELFKIGYSPNSWTALQSFLINKKKYKATDVERAGLISRGRGYYDRFRGRLMFPLKDHRGNVCGFSGRVLDPTVKEAKYINTQETDIYHKSDLLFGLSETKEAIKQAQSAIITEGELDMISSFQAGVQNVVAIKGSALTLNQIKLLKRYTQTLILALDADFAGDKAARRGIELADQEGLTIKVVEITGGKDPDEVAQKNPELWQKLVAGAVDIYDYFIDSAFNRFQGVTADDKRKIGAELVPILAKISNEIVRSHYVRELSRRLDISQEAVLEEIGKMKREPGLLDKPVAKVVEMERSRRETVEEYLLSLAFQAQKPEWLSRKKVFSVVETAKFTRILELLTTYLQTEDKFASKSFAKTLPGELVEAFDRMYMVVLGDLTESAEKAKVEFDRTLAELSKLAKHEKLTVMRRGIGDLERKKELSKSEEEKLDKLLNKFAKLSQKLAE
jgi:DNA primase